MCRGWQAGSHFQLTVQLIVSGGADFPRMSNSESGKGQGRLKRILVFLRPYYPLEAGILFIMLLIGALGLIDPLVLKILIDDVLIDKNAALLNVLVLGVAGLFILRASLNIVTNYLIYYISQRILFDIRFKLFRHLQGLHIDFFVKTKTGEIISRVNNDVRRIQSVLTTTLVSLTTDFVTLLAIIAIIIYLDWKLSLISLSLFPILFLVQLHMGRKIRTKSRVSRDKAAEIVSFFQEVFTSIRVVQSFVRERFEASRLIGKSRELINININVGMFSALAASVAGIFSALGPVIVIWYGGHQVINGALSLGGLVAFYAYLGRLFAPVSRLARHNVSIQSARAALDRIFEFLEIEPQITDNPNSVRLSSVRGHIIFNNVDFYYDPDEPVLNGVSFQVKPKQKVAIVGESGVGKTTIVNLLCRFYDPVSGSVLIDGNDVRNIKLSSLRNNIGIVSQDTILFNATIRENILYGKRRANEEEVREAASSAYIL
ncbi:MAG: ATP-binding cassette domain-containing protein, partial [Candidatus Latescibacteria bacterium]|nr:ATP-binding cassette domain-containing protein [bacterium]MBD3423295.1 ATP-binding cassette domain-containing protein [Candidatus Latescibacterota bacterium]